MSGYMHRITTRSGRTFYALIVSRSSDEEVLALRDATTGDTWSVDWNVISELKPVASS